MHLATLLGNMTTRRDSIETLLIVRIVSGTGIEVEPHTIVTGIDWPAARIKVAN